MSSLNIAAHRRRRLFLENLEQRAMLAAFTPGNLVIYRIGDGVETLQNVQGNTVFLDEFTTAGTLVQSVMMPNVASGANKPMIAQGGTGQNEGAMTLSVDGRYLVMGGYSNVIGGPLGGTATTLGQSTAGNVPRTIGRVDAAGTIDTTTTWNNFGSNPIRTVVSVDGTRYWGGGGDVTGVRTILHGGTAGTTVSADQSTRQLLIVDGNLYRSNQDNKVVMPNSIAQVGTGLPTGTGIISTPLPGLPTSATDPAAETFGPHSFFFADLSPAVPGSDTLYVVDNAATTGGIHKFSLVAGTWASNGRLTTATNFRSLTGVVQGSNVTMYSSRTYNQLFSITDTGGYNAAPVSVLSAALATSPTNTIFRGVAFAPDDGVGAIGGLAGTTNYTSGAAATSFASAATFVDASNLAGGSLTISYASGGQASDVLGVVAGNGITVAAGVVSFSGVQIATYPTSGPDSGLAGASLILTFNPNGTANPVLSNAVQALLRQVTFASAGTAGNRGLQVTVAQNGGLTATTTQTINVSVGAGNQTPVNSAPTTPILATEDIAVLFTGANLISVSDADAGATPITTTISVPNTTVGTFAATNGGGTASVSTSNGGATITINGPQSQINLALATLVFTPAAHRNTPADGATTITIVTSDGTAGDTDTVTITLTDVNDAPVAATDSLGTLAAEEGAAFTINASALLTNDNPGAPNESTQTITLTGVTNGTGGTVSLAGTTITFTPAANFSGTATFSYTITDNGLSGGMPAPLTGTGTVSLTISEVNDPPAATNDTLSDIAEDSGVRTIPFASLTANDSPGSGEASQALTITNVTAITGGTVTISGTNVNFTPTTNYFGPASFSYIVQDNGTTNGTAAPLTATATVSFNVTPVNDSPTVSAIADQNIGLNSSTGVLSFTIGDVETAVGSLTVSATSSNTTLVPNNVTNLVLGGSGANRTINVIPAVGQSGSATITVSVGDGAATVTEVFIVNVSANTTPTISDVPAQTIAEDGNLAPVAFTVGDAETAAATLVVTASSSNQTILPDAAIIIASTGGGGRTVAITPPANANGTMTITLTVTDGGSLTATDTFTFTITEVNDAPTAGNDTLASIAEDSGVLTIPFASLLGNDSAGPPNESSQSLAITGVTAIAGGTVSISGTNVLFTPTANFNGGASFSYTLADNGTTNGAAAPLTATGTASFTITAVNDAPSFTKGPDITLPLNSSAQSITGWATAISPGPANESTQTVSFNVTGNSNAGLFSVLPTVAPNGTLAFTPQTGATGTATITLVAQDNGGGSDVSSPQSFTITMLAAPVNLPPTINSIANLNINAGSGAQLVSFNGVSAGGTESQALAVTATSNNTTLIPHPSVNYASPNFAGSLTFAPAVGQTGNSTITVNVRDAGLDGTLNTGDDGLTSTQFTVTVTPFNAPPVASDQTLTTNLNTPVSGILHATDPDTASLSYSIVASPAIGTITSLNTSTGAFTYLPLSGATGLDVFTFRVFDGVSSDIGLVRVAIHGGIPTITPDGANLIVIGTPDPDQVIVSPLAAGTVRVRTQFGTNAYPVTGELIISTGDSDDLVVVSGLLLQSTIDGGNDNDQLSSGLQSDTIIGGQGHDRVNASGGINVVWGDTIDEPQAPLGGNDVISSLDGSDILFGGAGNDQIYAGSGHDYIAAGAGDDIVSGGAGNDRLYGNGGLDELFGDEGDDVLSGGAGADTLVGRTGNDLLIGGIDADWLEGQEGNDLMVGRELTMGSSSTYSDSADAALASLLSLWNSSHPANMLGSLTAPNDNAPDSLHGYIGDDDFYADLSDSTGDFNLPAFGADRRY